MRVPVARSCLSSSLATGPHASRCSCHSSLSSEFRAYCDGCLTEFGMTKELSRARREVQAPEVLVFHVATPGAPTGQAVLGSQVQLVTQAGAVLEPDLMDAVASGVVGVHRRL